MLLFVVILILPHKIMINTYNKISYFSFNSDWKLTFWVSNVSWVSKLSFESSVSVLGLKKPMVLLWAWNYYWVPTEYQLWVLWVNFESQVSASSINFQESSEVQGSPKTSELKSSTLSLIFLVFKSSFLI